jgi:peroxiredoxin
VCNREAPSVEEAAKKYQDSVNFIGVAWTGDDESFQGFIDKHGLTFPQISDDPGDVFNRFGVSYQPALVVVNTDGSTELLAGSVDSELLDQVISEAN